MWLDIFTYHYPFLAILPSASQLAEARFLATWRIGTNFLPSANHWPASFCWYGFSRPASIKYLPSLRVGQFCSSNRFTTPHPTPMHPFATAPASIPFATRTPRTYRPGASPRLEFPLVVTPTAELIGNIIRSSDLPSSHRGLRHQLLLRSHIATSSAHIYVSYICT